MRRLTKIAAVTAVFALALTGCGSNDDGESNNGTNTASEDVCESADGDGPKIGLAYDVGGRGDQSFNDSAYDGIEKAVDDLDATCIEAEATPGENDAARAERLRTLAEQGYNPVIAVGFIYSVAADQVAPDYPDVRFAVVDGFDPTEEPNENVAYLGFAEHEGSFLVGVAAALKSEAKHVGFVGGTHGDLIKRFEAGYVAGVKAVDPSIKIDVKYLTEDPNDGQGGFENPTGGNTAATGMYDAGADVVYHAAGKSGLGVFDAVEEAGEGNWAIGVDSDQYLTVDESQKPFILTSMLKRVDTAVYEFVSAVNDGEAPTSYVTYDLKSEGVGYSTSGGFVDDIKDEIESYREKILSGEIEVPSTP